MYLVIQKIVKQQDVILKIKPKTKTIIMNPETLILNQNLLFYGKGITLQITNPLQST